MTKSALVTKIEGLYSIGKVDGYGNGRKRCLAELEWRLEDGNFAMSGKIWNHVRSDIITGGQCVDTIAKYFPENKKVQQMLAIWERWHLNNMKAGCEHQRTLGWEKDGYDKHPCEPCPICGYRYGSAWLKEELPADVVNTILSWSD
ncbi:restriction alleviation protein lar [Caudoviricetes sp.]|nr:restriction alleviation protein lar [Caudoviricetes sp.]UOF81021.1 restriction alleviation protein lar [Caudoviricetes sp.]UOF81417.1 restriction alleviation protein lar [Caudoviricetes sp.]